MLLDLNGIITEALQGKDLLEPPYSITKEMLWALVVTDEKLPAYHYILPTFHTVEPSARSTGPITVCDSLGGMIPLDVEHVSAFSQLLEVWYALSDCKNIIACLEKKQRSSAPEQRKIGYDTEQLTRKADYRTEQWEKATPIARTLYEKNNKITLEEIKNDPAFKACFKEMPSDDTIRDRLNKAGIKLAPGKR